MFSGSLESPHKAKQRNDLGRGRGCPSGRSCKAEPRESCAPGKGLCSWFASAISMVSLLPAPTAVPTLLSAFGLPSQKLWAGRLETGRPTVVPVWHFLVVFRQMARGGMVLVAFSNCNCVIPWFWSME